MVFYVDNSSQHEIEEKWNVKQYKVQSAWKNRGRSGVKQDLEKQFHAHLLYTDSALPWSTLSNKLKYLWVHGGMLFPRPRIPDVIKRRTNTYNWPAHIYPSTNDDVTNTRWWGCFFFKGWSDEVIASTNDDDMVEDGMFFQMMALWIFLY